jgi:hypothetical protein
MSKKLSVCVRPGVLEVRASPCCRQTALRRLDLPTFERPEKLQRRSGRSQEWPIGNVRVMRTLRM